MRYILSIFLFFSLYSLSAQTEINVKLKTTPSTLRAYFQQNQNKQINATARAAKTNLGYSFLSKLAYIQPLAMSEKSAPLKDIFTLHFEEGNKSLILNELNASGQFEFVAENKKVKLDLIETTEPNDDSLSQQWYHKYIQTFEAWNISKGKSDVVIGVIDTGIDYGHPDLEGQVAIRNAEDINQNGTFEAWRSDTTINGKTGDFDGIDQDGNGFVDDVIGYDFVDAPRNPIGGDYLDQDPNPSDEHFHGTFVSGIIVAKDNNKLGGVGVAPNCKVLVLRAFDAGGSGEDDDISRAIVYAADNGVKILNFSFGDAYPSEMMHEAIKYAYSKGVVMIGSAGNGTGDDLHYPSGFDEVISVSATAAYNGNETIWQATSYGLTVSLAAPGSGVFSTTLRDSVRGKWVEYTTASGTSASAPMVSAAVGLIFAQKGEVSPQQARGMLINGADDILYEGWDHYTGGGRLNVFKTLQVSGGSNVQILSPDNDSGSAKDSAYVVATILEPEMTKYSLSFQKGTEGNPDWQIIVDEQHTQIFQDTIALWNLAGLAEGEYTLRLRVERTDGFATEDRIRFIRDKSTPEMMVKTAAPIWDNNERKMFFLFRSSDQGKQKLHYRPLNSTSDFSEILFDRTTRNGEFLLDKSNISSGDYEFYLSCTNPSGIVGQSPLDTFTFASANVEMSGYNVLKYTLPMGTFLNQPFDFDNDGKKEVVLNQYDSRLNFGKLMFYEYNASNFIAADSVRIRPVLLPKDVKDIDGNGTLELLCNVNDSTFILTPSAAGKYPIETVQYTRNGNNLYPSRFADVDKDGTYELIMKNFKDHFVYNKAGNEFLEGAKLTDTTGNYLGSIAPRTLFADFDNDGKMEIVYGDYDGDFIIYEYDSPNKFNINYIDTTDIFKAGEYLTQGDFDGDGKMEFFVITHTLPGMKNADIEYDAAYLQLRIFKATGDNQYEKVWEDYLYDLDTDEYNAATAGNIDTDAADEIIITSFPRTYLLDYQNGAYKMAWFSYGHLATHHIIGDFNGNGVAEFGLGRGDSTFFYEMDFNYNGPQVVTSLEGWVRGKDSTTLVWQKVPNATQYVVLRFNYDDLNEFPMIDSTTNNFYYDNTAYFGKRYIYALQSENLSLNTPYSDYSNAILLRPHTRNTIQNVDVINEHQISVRFHEDMIDREADKPKFLLNGKHTPLAILPKGNKELILSFAEPFDEGVNQLVIDSMLLDVEVGMLGYHANVASFTYENVFTPHLFLTNWAALNEKEAKLSFNFPLSNDVFETKNYTVAPYGSLISVEAIQNDPNSIKVKVDKAVLGAVGYSTSITIQNVTATNGAKILVGEGNTATFSGNKDALANVYSYPNPVRKNDIMSGMRFANLTKHATIHIYTLSGRFINKVIETDGDGGVDWDMKDESGTHIGTGVYWYKVSAEDAKDFIGKFSVVED